MVYEQFYNSSHQTEMTVREMPRKSKNRQGIHLSLNFSSQREKHLHHGTDLIRFFS